MILIDSNILIDVLEPDPVWQAWSSAQLREATRIRAARVTPVVLAEVGPRYTSLTEFRQILRDFGLPIESLSDEAAFMAGQAFREYRRTREGPKSVLADFLIGGQAAVTGATILTRAPAIYARYFPDVPLIAPIAE